MCSLTFALVGVNSSLTLHKNEGLLHLSRTKPEVSKKDKITMQGGLLFNRKSSGFLLRKMQ